MIKTEICRKLISFDCDYNVTLVYCLVTDDIKGEREAFQYGVSIEIPEKNEEEIIRNITPRKEKAMWLLDLLASNFVTPVTLKDVVYDCLCM